MRLGFSSLALYHSTAVVRALDACIGDLTQAKWTLSSPTYPNIRVLGTVPSQVHLDLFAAGVIPDPYFGRGDYELRWVTYANWTYATLLDHLDTSGNLSTWLLFNGLDTFTSIDLCGHHIASTNNQFRQYYFDVSTILQYCNGSHLLEINFGSAVNISQLINDLPDQETWPIGVEGLFVFPNRQFIRKEQSDFGWDWGPAFAPAGIWQPAYSIQLPPAGIYVRNTLVDIYRLGQLNNLPPDQNAPWVVNASLDVLGPIPIDAGLTIEIQDVNNKTLETLPAQNIIRMKSRITGSVLVDGGSYKRWWPTGLGEQNLYNFKISIESKDQVLATVTKRSGFRTIVLNMEPISEAQLATGIAPGNNWHFEINGHEFYAKGSNFIPPDAFWPRVTEMRIKQLFQSVVDGNQNMLRVWASGAYLPDFIYDIADEMGVLLWSEFEFGDALYPINSEFLENVHEEANYNVRRVNHHPSLALWAGGNELENLELPMAGSDPKWKAEYETLFLDVLLPSVFSNTKSISYIPSSTTNGYLTLNHSLPHPMTQRYENKTSGFIYGDTDHYAYNSSIAFDLSSYPVGRFANEFGYHSMPSIYTWRQALSPSDLGMNSTTILLRNHHYPPGGPEPNWASTISGMSEMTTAVQQYYPLPAQENPIANFSSWCWSTQLFQALYYRSQITYYRRGSGFPERQLGTLYWQLEDIWQAPTWAGIEYDGRWKILHYLAKDVYQPVIVASYWNASTGDLSAYVTSDLWSEASGNVTLQWWDYNGTAVSDQVEQAFTVGGLNTTLVLQTNTTALPYDLTRCILRMNVTATGTPPNAPSNCTATYTHTSVFHTWELKNAKLSNPGLVLSFDKENNTFIVKATQAVAAFVWLELPEGVGGNFEDNGFWLLPEEGDKRLQVKLKGEGPGLEDGSWLEKVTVRSLWDNYVV